jgi:Na+/proline symporter
MGLYRPTSGAGLYAAMLVTVTYTLIATVLLPDLWRGALGPLPKVIPIFVLNLVALAVLEDR